jgi:hypothetical protein
VVTDGSQGFPVVTDGSQGFLVVTDGSQGFLVVTDQESVASCEVYRIRVLVTDTG